MESSDRVEAAVGQLEEVRDQAKWALGFAFSATLLALQGTDTLDLLGLSLTRTRAFFVIAILFIASCAAAAGHLRRLAFLLSGLPAGDLPMAFDKLAAHSWLLNPFIFDQLGPARRSRGAWGWTFLVITFWLCMVCLYALLPDLAFRSPIGVLFEHGLFSRKGWIHAATLLAYMAPIGAFAATGYLALEAVPALIGKAAERTPEAPGDYKGRLARHAAELKRAGDLGIGIGGMLMLLVLTRSHWSG